MNLTIEQMQEIVDGAPEGATHHKYVGANKLDLYFDENHHLEFCDFQGWCFPRFHHTKEIISRMNNIEDIRRALAARKTKMHSHLTSGVFQDDDHTDHVTDIRNHISPNTRVSEAHVNEAFKLNRLG
ncbi:hypothetical protein HYI12_17625 [Acinetobacter sp. SwsAc3]|nr:hypothetical protein [Acinetobacter sp. SwsAc3]